MYLGLGIQSNTARLLRDGAFYPDHGLERIVAYHERQDARFAEAAAQISDATGKPILTATELAVAQPDNPGPGNRSRHRPALLLERESSRHRARAPAGTTPGIGSRAGRSDVTGKKLAGLHTVGHRVDGSRRHPVLDPAAATAAQRAVVVDTRQVRTPLWSARRVPALLARTVESETQARAADSLTKLVRAIVAPVDACVAVDGPNGPLARVGADVALAPASTLKLLTAVTAIDRLGPDHRFADTRAAPTRPATSSSSAAAIRSSRPTNTSSYEHGISRFRNAPYTKLSDLADAIVAAGVHEVSGALVVDDHIHDSLRFLSTWKPGYTLEGDVGSLGALAVDGGYDQPNDQLAATDPAVSTGQRLAALLARPGRHDRRWRPPRIRARRRARNRAHRFAAGLRHRR